MNTSSPNWTGRWTYREKVVYEIVTPKGHPFVKTEDEVEAIQLITALNKNGDQSNMPEEKKGKS